MKLQKRKTYRTSSSFVALWADAKKEPVGLTSNPLGSQKDPKNQTSSSSKKPQLATEFSLISYHSSLQELPRYARIDWKK